MATSNTTIVVRSRESKFAIFHDGRLRAELMATFPNCETYIESYYALKVILLPQVIISYCRAWERPSKEMRYSQVLDGAACAVRATYAPSTFRKLRLVIAYPVSSRLI